MRNWMVQARVAKGMTQKQVADMSGVAQPTYWNIEQGKKNPTVATAKRIAGVLGVPWVKFFDGEDDEPCE